MVRTSAGLLLYRTTASGDVEVLLVHPGGPFWAKKNEAAWSIPKGEYDAAEDPSGCGGTRVHRGTGLGPAGRRGRRTRHACGSPRPSR